MGKDLATQAPRQRGDKGLLLSGLRVWGILLICSVSIPAQTIVQKSSLDTEFGEILQYVKNNDYENAAKYIGNLNVFKLAKQSAESDHPKYVGTRGFGTIVPGIPKWRVPASDSSLIIVPGTSDSANTKSAATFQDAALDFADEFNMYLRYLTTKVEIKVGELELEEVRDVLSCSEKEWEAVSLRSKLKIRRLAEDFEHVAKENDRLKDLVSKLERDRLKHK